MYSPLGLVIFLAVEGTFVCFTKGQDHLFQIQFVVAAYEQTNACLCLRSCIQKCTGNIGRRHSARRHRIAPFDLRRASLPVGDFIFHMDRNVRENFLPSDWSRVVNRATCSVN